MNTRTTLVILIVVAVTIGITQPLSITLQPTGDITGEIKITQPNTPQNTLELDKPIEINIDLTTKQKINERVKLKVSVKKQVLGMWIPITQKTQTRQIMVEKDEKIEFDRTIEVPNKKLVQALGAEGQYQISAELVSEKTGETISEIQPTEVALE